MARNLISKREKREKYNNNNLFIINIINKLYCNNIYYNLIKKLRNGNN